MRASYFLTLFTLSLFLVSCSKYSKTESGLRYKVLYKSPEKKLPVAGEYLQCFYSISNSEDSIIFSNFGQTPDRILLGEPTHKGGDIMDALGMMSVGDSILFLINADSFYQKTRMEELPSYVKPNSDLKFVIKMDRSLNKYQVDSLVNVEKLKRWNEEIENINAYVKKNSLEVTLDTLTGIRMYFYQKQADSAKRVNEGSVIQFHMIGKLMDGTEFFNSYTTPPARVVKVTRSDFKPIGMYEMLTKMKEGEKAIFILPYDLAYGAKGVEGMIPPFSTLVYDINILKVE